jgi:hypothetical protein
MKILLLQPGHSLLDLFNSPSPHEITSIGGGQKLSWREIFSFLRSFPTKSTDLLVVTEREKSLLYQKDGWIRGAVRACRSFFQDPVDFLILLLFAKAVRLGIPIAMINRSDNGRILPGSDWFYRRCHACFVRELHPQPEIALQDLFTPSGGNPQNNRRARQLIARLDPGCPSVRDISKLHPISLGARSEALSTTTPENTKEWDLFFSGNLNEKGLRGRLLEELRSVAERKKWKVLLRDRVPYAEYLRCMAASKLSFSPPGMGWDCWRHYEAMLAGSIPVMSYPTILQHQPAIDGEHCFYFAPEPGGLTRCLEKAMQHSERFPAMAEAGRKLALEHHTYPKLCDYVIQKTIAVTNLNATS